MDCGLGIDWEWFGLCGVMIGFLWIAYLDLMIWKWFG